MVHNGLRKASLIGGALAAVVASLCCLGPLVLVTAGVSGAWIAGLAAFEPYRPYALGLALVCAGFAYRSIYRAPAPQACEPGTLCAVPETRRLYRLLFWIMCAMLVVALGYPYTARFFY
jgi:mercuric ion transport protein